MILPLQEYSMHVVCPGNWLGRLSGRCQLWVSSSTAGKLLVRRCLPLLTHAITPKGMVRRSQKEANQLLTEPQLTQRGEELRTPQWVTRKWSGCWLSRSRQGFHPQNFSEKSDFSVANIHVSVAGHHWPVWWALCLCWPVLCPFNCTTSKFSNCINGCVLVDGQFRWLHVCGQLCVSI